MEKAIKVSEKGLGVSWSDVATWVLDNLSKTRSKYVLYQSVRRERRALANLSAEQLVDLGINHSDAVIESTRGYLDIPEDRLQNHKS